MHMQRWIGAAQQHKKMAHQAFRVGFRVQGYNCGYDSIPALVAVRLGSGGAEQPDWKATLFYLCRM